jgi:uncharacterized membrane protein
MISAEWIYWVIAGIFISTGILTGTDPTNPKRWGSATFWIVLGGCFAYSYFVTTKAAPAWLLGAAILLLTALVGAKQLAVGTADAMTEREQQEGADRLGSKLFVPVLLIPVIAVIFAVLIVRISVGGKPLLSSGTETLTGLAVGSLIAAVVAMIMVKRRNPMAPIRDGARLTAAIGWAAVLPQLLATLGTLFATAGVGKAIQTIIGHIVPASSLIGSVIVYCLGMFVFTVIMGNAFAAFPIMTAAIGWPLLVQVFHGNPASVFAIGMLAGFCGTLQTPMAANFNLVPAALLETRSKYAVIKAQSPTGLVLLVCNMALMYFLCFPH